MVVSMAILGVIVSLGLMVSLSTIERSSVDAERDTLVALLSESRARATANVHESAHGVLITDDAFMLFEGLSYSASSPTSRVSIARSGAISATGSLEFSFEPLSGNSPTGQQEVTLVSDSVSRAVLVSPIGRIEW